MKKIIFLVLVLGSFLISGCSLENQENLDIGLSDNENNTEDTEEIQEEFHEMSDSLGKVSDDIKNGIIEKIEAGEDRMTFLENDIDIKKNGKKEIYFGVRNDNDDAKVFDIDFYCDSSMEDDVTEADIEDYITFNHFKETKELEKDEIMVLKAVAEISPNAVATTYMCTVNIDEGDYVSKTFYITVTS